MPTYLSRILLASQSRPNVNGQTSNSHDYIGPDRKARPIKHWRRQLLPTGGSGSGGASRAARGAPVSSMERPGVTVVKSQEDCCDASGGSLYLTKEGIDFSGCTSLVTVQNNGNVAIGNPDIPTESYNIQTGIFDTATIACSPQNNIIKSAVTLLSKSYFSNNRAYLQSRNMRYDQRQTLSPISGIEYTTGSGANIEVRYPTDTDNGPQVFNMTTCSQTNHGGTNCTITTIYKPNNRNFSVEGAVSSSTRLDKLKVDTINKNAASFRQSWGDQGANAAKYSSTVDAPYFTKSKNYVCDKGLYHKKGNPTACFHTNVADMVHQMPTTNRVITRNPIDFFFYISQEPVTDNIDAAAIPHVRGKFTVQAYGSSGISFSWEVAKHHDKKFESVGASGTITTTRNAASGQQTSIYQTATLVDDTKNGWQYRCKLTLGESILYTNVSPILPAYLWIHDEITISSAYPKPHSTTVKAPTTGTVLLLIATIQSGIDLTYTWEASSLSSPAWVVVKGPTTGPSGPPGETYTTPARANVAGDLDTYYYRCSVSDPLGSALTVLSNKATVEVTLDNKISIHNYTPQSRAASVNIFGEIPLTVHASTTNPAGLIYQWQESSDNFNFSSIPGEISDTIDLTNIQTPSSNPIYYRCQLSTASPPLSLDSESFTITVKTASIDISTDLPATTPVLDGSTKTFTFSTTINNVSSPYGKMCNTWSKQPPGGTWQTVQQINSGLISGGSTTTYKTAVAVAVDNLTKYKCEASWAESNTSDYSCTHPDVTTSSTITTLIVTGTVYEQIGSFPGADFEVFMSNSDGGITSYPVYTGFNADTALPGSLDDLASLNVVLAPNMVPITFGSLSFSGAFNPPNTSINLNAPIRIGVARGFLQINTDSFAAPPYDGALLQIKFDGPAAALTPELSHISVDLRFSTHTGSWEVYFPPGEDMYVRGNSLFIYKPGAAAKQLRTLYDNVFETPDSPAPNITITIKYTY